MPGKAFLPLTTAAQHPIIDNTYNKEEKAYKLALQFVTNLKLLRTKLLGSDWDATQFRGHTHFSSGFKDLFTQRTTIDEENAKSLFAYYDFTKYLVLLCAEKGIEFNVVTKSSPNEVREFLNRFIVKKSDGTKVTLDSQISQIYQGGWDRAERGLAPKIDEMAFHHRDPKIEYSDMMLMDDDKGETGVATTRGAYTFANLEFCDKNNGEFYNEDPSVKTFADGTTKPTGRFGLTPERVEHSLIFRTQEFLLIKIKEELKNPTPNLDFIKAAVNNNLSYFQNNQELKNALDEKNYTLAIGSQGTMDILPKPPTTQKKVIFKIPSPPTTPPPGASAAVFTPPPAPPLPPTPAAAAASDQLVPPPSKENKANSSFRLHLPPELSEHPSFANSASPYKKYQKLTTGGADLGHESDDAPEEGTLVNLIPATKTAGARLTKLLFATDMPALGVKRVLVLNLDDFNLDRDSQDSAQDWGLLRDIIAQARQQEIPLYLTSQNQTGISNGLPIVNHEQLKSQLENDLLKRGTSQVEIFYLGSNLEEAKTNLGSKKTGKLRLSENEFLGEYARKFETTGAAAAPNPSDVLNELFAARRIRAATSASTPRKATTGLPLKDMDIGEIEESDSDLPTTLLEELLPHSAAVEPLLPDTASTPTALPARAAAMAPTPTASAPATPIAAASAAPPVLKNIRYGNLKVPTYQDTFRKVCTQNGEFNFSLDQVAQRALITDDGQLDENALKFFFPGNYFKDGLTHKIKLVSEDAKKEYIISSDHGQLFLKNSPQPLTPGAANIENPNRFEVDVFVAQQILRGVSIEKQTVGASLKQKIPEVKSGISLDDQADELREKFAAAFRALHSPQMTTAATGKKTKAAAPKEKPKAKKSVLSILKGFAGKSNDAPQQPSRATSNTAGAPELVSSLDTQSTALAAQAMRIQEEAAQASSATASQVKQVDKVSRRLAKDAKKGNAEAAAASEAELNVLVNANAGTDTDDALLVVIEKEAGLDKDKDCYFKARDQKGNIYRINSVGERESAKFQIFKENNPLKGKKASQDKVVTNPLTKTKLAKAFFDDLKKKLSASLNTAGCTYELQENYQISYTSRNVTIPLKVENSKQIDLYISHLVKISAGLQRTKSEQKQNERKASQAARRAATTLEPTTAGPGSPAGTTTLPGPSTVAAATADSLTNTGVPQETASTPPQFKSTRITKVYNAFQNKDAQKIFGIKNFASQSGETETKFLAIIHKSYNPTRSEALAICADSFQVFVQDETTKYVPDLEIEKAENIRIKSQKLLILEEIADAITNTGTKIEQLIALTANTNSTRLTAEELQRKLDLLTQCIAFQKVKLQNIRQTYQPHDHINFAIGLGNVRALEILLAQDLQHPSPNVANVVNLNHAFGQLNRSTPENRAVFIGIIQQLVQTNPSLANAISSNPRAKEKTQYFIDLAIASGDANLVQSFIDAKKRVALQNPSSIQLQISAPTTSEHDSEITRIIREYNDSLTNSVQNSGSASTTRGNGAGGPLAPSDPSSSSLPPPFTADAPPLPPTSPLPYTAAGGATIVPAATGPIIAPTPEPAAPTSATALPPAPTDLPRSPQASAAANASFDFTQAIPRGTKVVAIDLDDYFNYEVKAATTLLVGGAAHTTTTADRNKELLQQFIQYCRDNHITLELYSKDLDKAQTYLASQPNSIDSPVKAMGNFTATVGDLALDYSPALSAAAEAKDGHSKIFFIKKGLQERLNKHPEKPFPTALFLHSDTFNCFEQESFAEVFTALNRNDIQNATSIDRPLPTQKRPAATPVKVASESNNLFASRLAKSTAAHQAKVLAGTATLFEKAIPHGTTAIAVELDDYCKYRSGKYQASLPDQTCLQSLIVYCQSSNIKLRFYAKNVEQAQKFLYPDNNNNFSVDTAAANLQHKVGMLISRNANNAAEPAKVFFIKKGLANSKESLPLDLFQNPAAFASFEKKSFADVIQDLADKNVVEEQPLTIDEIATNLLQFLQNYSLQDPSKPRKVHLVIERAKLIKAGIFTHQELDKIAEIVEAGNSGVTCTSIELNTSLNDVKNELLASEQQNHNILVYHLGKSEKDVKKIADPTYDCIGIAAASIKGPRDSYKIFTARERMLVPSDIASANHAPQNLLDEEALSAKESEFFESAIPTSVKAIAIDFDDYFDLSKPRTVLTTTTQNGQLTTTTINDHEASRLQLLKFIKYCDTKGIVIRIFTKNPDLADSFIFRGSIHKNYVFKTSADISININAMAQQSGGAEGSVFWMSRNIETLASAKAQTSPSLFHNIAAFTACKEETVDNVIRSLEGRNGKNLYSSKPSILPEVPSEEAQPITVTPSKSQFEQGKKLHTRIWKRFSSEDLTNGTAVYDDGIRDIKLYEMKGVSENYAILRQEGAFYKLFGNGKIETSQDGVNFAKDSNPSTLQKITSIFEDASRTQNIHDFVEFLAHHEDLRDKNGHVVIDFDNIKNEQDREILARTAEQKGLTVHLCADSVQEEDALENQETIASKIKTSPDKKLVVRVKGESRLLAKKSLQKLKSSDWDHAKVSFASILDGSYRENYKMTPAVVGKEKGGESLLERFRRNFRRKKSSDFLGDATSEISVNDDDSDSISAGSSENSDNGPQITNLTASDIGESFWNSRIRFVENVEYSVDKDTGSKRFTLELPTRSNPSDLTKLTVNYSNSEYKIYNTTKLDVALLVKDNELQGALAQAQQQIASLKASAEAKLTQSKNLYERIKATDFTKLGFRSTSGKLEYLTASDTTTQYQLFADGVIRTTPLGSTDSKFARGAGFDNARASLETVFTTRQTTLQEAETRRIAEEQARAKQAAQDQETASALYQFIAGQNRELKLQKTTDGRGFIFPFPNGGNTFHIYPNSVTMNDGTDTSRALGEEELQTISRELREIAIQEISGSRSGVEYLLQEKLRTHNLLYNENLLSDDNNANFSPRQAAHKKITESFAQIRDVATPAKHASLEETERKIRAEESLAEKQYSIFKDLKDPNIQDDSTLNLSAKGIYSNALRAAYVEKHGKLRATNADIQDLGTVMLGGKSFIEVSAEASEPVLPESADQPEETKNAWHGTDGRLWYQRFANLSFGEGDETVDLRGIYRSVFNNCRFGKNCKFEAKDFDNFDVKYFSNCDFSEALIQELNKQSGAGDLLLKKLGIDKATVTSEGFYTSATRDKTAKFSKKPVKVEKEDDSATPNSSPTQPIKFSKFSLKSIDNIPPL